MVRYLTIAMGMISFLIWVTVIGVANTNQVVVGGVVSALISVYFYFRLKHLLKKKEDKEAEKEKK